MCNRMSSFIRKICFIKAYTEETDTDRQTDRQTDNRQKDGDRKRVNNRR